MDNTKRAAVFAHYTSNKEIEDYVVFYLENLKKIADFVVFVSDSEINENELLKIKPYVDKIIAKPHGEYDFGSYKRGYFYLKEQEILNTAEELIFANDSCYAPLFPFEAMFSAMEKVSADFWGNTQNYTEEITKNKGKEHIQSYFLVFKKNVFNSKVFEDFMAAVSSEKTKNDIIEKYEMGLSIALKNAGFKHASYCALSKLKNDTQLLSYASLILKDHSPFLKRGLTLLKFADCQYPFRIKKLIEKTEYDYSLIEKDVRKNRIKLSAFKLSYFFLSTSLRVVKYRILKCFGVK